MTATRLRLHISSLIESFGKATDLVERNALSIDMRLIGRDWSARRSLPSSICLPQYHDILLTFYNANMYAADGHFKTKRYPHSYITWLSQHGSVFHIEESNGHGWNPLTKDQWRNTFRLSLVSAWARSRIKADDWRRHETHFDVTVIQHMSRVSRTPLFEVETPFLKKTDCIRYTFWQRTSPNTIISWWIIYWIPIEITMIR